MPQVVPAHPRRGRGNCDPSQFLNEACCDPRTGLPRNVQKLGQSNVAIAMKAWGGVQPQLAVGRIRGLETLAPW